jgi:hypothetical protein
MYVVLTGTALGLLVPSLKRSTLLWAILQHSKAA